MELVRETLEILKGKKVPLESGLAVVRLMDLLGNDKDQIRSIIMDKKALDPFTGILIQDVVKEKDRLVNSFEEFFNSKQADLKISEIYDRIVEFQLQIERLSLVIQPVLSKVTFTKGDKEYDSAKILWLDEKRNKVRISRTFGQKGEAGLLGSLQKYIQELVRVDEEYLDHRFENQYIFDLALKVGGELYGVDFKFSKKEAFLDSLSRLELWNLYKNTYMV